MIDAKLLVNYIESKSDFILYNKELFDVLEGELLPRLRDALRQQVLSDRAFKVANHFVPPINIVKRLVDKLSVVYATPPTRTTENELDQMLVDYYSESVNSAFGEANRFFNSMKAAAVEPYVKDFKPAVRVIPGHRCLVKSDDVVDPLNETLFIKFVGEYNKNGIKKSLYFAYTDADFIAFDSDGEVIEQYMGDSGGLNLVGVIPQTYIKRSRNLLIPKSDTDLLQMGKLIPTMIANLNYAAHMQGHSIIYGIDIDGTNLEINPDSMWLLQTSPSGVKPDIGTLKPSVDISEIWASINSQMQVWLETRGIRPGEATGQAASSSSGIALMVKEMDATNDIKEQIRYFRYYEEIFWKKLKQVHNYWVYSGAVQDMPMFSNEFDIQVEFADHRPSEDKGSVIDQQIKMVNELLTSRKRARKVVHKDLDQNAIDEIEMEIMEEMGNGNQNRSEEDSIQDNGTEQEVQS